MTRSPLTSEKKNYVHLADGGIADNLGLSPIIDDLLTPDKGGSAALYGNLRNTKRVVVLVVNARADQAVERDESPSPPGIFEMIWTSIGAAIDNRSSGLVDDLTAFEERLSQIGRARGLETRVAIVDFDRIRDPACRYQFAHTPTNWNLEDGQIDSLMEMASAMVRGSPAMHDLAHWAGGDIGAPQGAYAGQRRAWRACQRMAAKGKRDFGAPMFGHEPLNPKPIN